MRDWTIEKYLELLRTIGKSGRKVYGVADYLISEVYGVADYLINGNGKCRKIIIRHDIDISADEIFSVAGFENAFKFRATYYFRKKNFEPAVIEKLKLLNHEIGYHYEVIDRANGNNALAEHLFREDLERFRKSAEIKTVSAHLNPLTSYDNRDFWKNHKLEDFDLIGEAYLSFLNKPLVYFTDTDRIWEQMRFERKDRMIPNGSFRILNANSDIRSTEQLCDFILNYDGDIYLSVHPERWTTNFPNWVRWGVRDWLASAIKRILTIRR